MTRIEKRRRALVVGDPSNGAIANWISQLEPAGWDIHFFATQTTPANKHLKVAALHRTFYPLWPSLVLPILREAPSKVSYFPNLEAILPAVLPTHASFPLPMPRLPRALAKILEGFVIPPLLNLNAYALSKVIREVRPDWVNAFGPLQAGYLTFSASRYLGPQMPKWILTGWGDRTRGAGQSPSEQEKMRIAARAADFYAAGSTDWIPAGEDNRSRKGDALAVADRKLIFVDLSDGAAAQTALTFRALQECAESLRGYCVVPQWSPGAGPTPMPQIELNFRIREPVSLSHDARIQLLGLSRIFIAPRLTEHSTLLVDAMTMGAFPICASRECSDLSIQNGKNGLVWDGEKLASLIQRALTDDALVQSATEANRNLIRRTYREKFN
jgi:hypothetical protein